jgi:hypothetical protein
MDVLAREPDVAETLGLERALLGGGALVHGACAVTDRRDNEIKERAGARGRPVLSG